MSEDTVESERPHGTNWSGLKLTEEKNGAERVRSEKWQKGNGISMLGLRNSKMTCTGILALLLLHLLGNTSANDLPKHEHKLLVITEIIATV